MKIKTTNSSKSEIKSVGDTTVMSRSSSDESSLKSDSTIRDFVEIDKYKTDKELQFDRARTSVVMKF